MLSAEESCSNSTSGGIILKTITSKNIPTETPKKAEQDNQETKLPYKKPELKELGSVGDMTMTSVGREIGW